MREYSHYAQALSAAVVALGLGGAAFAQNAPATFTTRSLTPETALKAAQAALAHCRKEGFQAAVAVVDRAGVPQVMLRDRLAGAHTPETAIAKGWTAVSFRTNTTALAEETQAGKSMSGIRHLPRVAMIGGGMLIEAGGTTLGGIGVSGGPGAAADDACAKAGIKAIADDIEF
ncbi:MAG: heme-binding protein [Burkholderiales bacterium]|nr:heme-binding protein [Burkholderiales bacterium]